MKRIPLQKLIDILNLTVKDMQDSQHNDDKIWAEGIKYALGHAKQALKEEKKHYKLIRITEYSNK